MGVLPTFYYRCCAVIALVTDDILTAAYSGRCSIAPDARDNPDATGTVAVPAILARDLIR